MVSGSSDNQCENCWEFMDCPVESRKNCQVYVKDLGNHCWLVVKDVLEGCFHCKEFDGCINCPWFKKNNPKIKIPV